MLKNKVAKNASWIIGCKIIQSLAAFIIGMFTARYLGPSNYGLINYASSVVSFVVPIMHLGITNILVQEIIQCPDDEGVILGTSLVLCCSSSVLCMVGAVSFTLIANVGEADTIIVCALYSISLFTQALEIVQYWYQAKFLSKYTAIVSVFAYLIIALYKIFLLVTEKNIYWFAVSGGLDYLIISICIIVIYKKLGGAKLKFDLQTAKRLFSKGKYYIVSSMMVTIFAQTDKIMLKLMIDNSATGYYSTAVTCAGISSFVFAAIIDSFRPLIFEKKKENDQEFEKSLTQLYAIVIYLSLLQSLVMTFFAGLIIKIIYGASYLAAVPALQVVVWYSTFSYLGSVRNIWILAENKQKYLWVINLTGALFNIILNLLLIPIMGIIGAALASLCTQFFTNVIIGFIIRPIMHNNFIMFKSLNPKVLICLLKNKGKKCNEKF